MQRRPAPMAVVRLPHASPIWPIATTRLPTGAKPIYKHRQPIADHATTHAIRTTERQLARPVNAALPAHPAFPIATALSPMVVKSIYQGVWTTAATAGPNAQTNPMGLPLAIPICKLSVSVEFPIASPRLATVTKTPPTVAKPMKIATRTIAAVAASSAASITQPPNAHWAPAELVPVTRALPTATGFFPTAVKSISILIRTIAKRVAQCVPRPMRWVRASRALARLRLARAVSRIAISTGRTPRTVARRTLVAARPIAELAVQPAAVPMVRPAAPQVSAISPAPLVSAIAMAMSAMAARPRQRTMP